MADKKYLLHCIDMIINADKSTIDLLRMSPLANTKLIERSSKCLKDPNPLSSTMTNMSLKYPLSVDINKARKYNIPHEYIPENNKWDTHYHGRVLCKKEAIEWWITESPLPSDNIIKVMDLIMKLHRRETKEYRSVNWENAKLSWGQPNLERRLVATRNPEIAVEKSIREQAIMLALMPDFITPKQNVPRKIVQDIKDVTHKELAMSLSLSTQVRLLLNMMDPRMRVLPVLPGTLESIAYMKHALVHNNLVVKIAIENDFVNIELARKLNMISDVFRQLYLTKNPDKVMEAIRECTYFGTKLKVILKQNNSSDTSQIKWLKVIFNMDISSEYENQGGLITSPQNSNVRPIMTSNKVGVRFKTYNGKEIVGFKYGHLRGSFTHNGTSLLNLTTNYTDSCELKKMVAEVAVYCRFNMELSKQKTFAAMKTECRTTVYLNPTEFLRCTTLELELVTSGDRNKAGPLVIVQNSEYNATKMLSPYVDERGNISSNRGGQTIILPEIPEGKHLVFPEGFECAQSVVIDHLDFRRLLLRKIYFYKHNIKILNAKIKSGDYTWENEALSHYIGVHDHRKISTLCRGMLYGIIDPLNNSIPFLYCFCNVQPLDSIPNIHVFVIGNYTLDLTGKIGIFIEKEDGTYSLFNRPMELCGKLEIGRTHENALDGFVLRRGVTIGEETVTLGFLHREKKRIPVGTQYNTYLNGIMYTATRDNLYQYSIEETISRHLREKNKWMQDLMYNVNLGKRHFAEDDEDEPPNKKSKEKVDEIDMVVTSYDDDFDMTDDIEY